jgi:hypothetical protein
MFQSTRQRPRQSRPGGTRWRGSAADELGVRVRPHDLRRIFAKLAHKGGSPSAPIQLSRGHSSLTRVRALARSRPPRATSASTTTSLPPPAMAWSLGCEQGDVVMGRLGVLLVLQILASALTMMQPVTGVPS